MKGKIAYCFDLDGTVTLQEILPKIAQEVDLFEEIQLLTEATLKGIIPFEKSFRLRCKLFSDIPITKVQKIISHVVLDADITNFIATHLKQCFIITGNLDIWVAPLAQQLGCQFYTSKAEHQDNKFIRLSQILNKGEAVRSIRENFDYIITIGDSMNDVPMFEEADIGIAYAGVHNPVGSLLDMSHYVVTNGKGLCQLLNTL
ncbi:MAG: hypothetical protein A2X78_03015 [Gammaproteobacteria bacterium GWE2_37_16]|nr:MAG: hypothetical protein A2X78_03015 [Gammaproteobacteria bacterium GWE2_37_16]